MLPHQSELYILYTIYIIDIDHKDTIYNKKYVTDMSFRSNLAVKCSFTDT